MHPPMFDHIPLLAVPGPAQSPPSSAVATSAGRPSTSAWESPRRRSILLASLSCQAWYLVHPVLFWPVHPIARLRSAYIGFKRVNGIQGHELVCRVPSTNLDDHSSLYGSSLGYDHHHKGTRLNLSLPSKKSWVKVLGVYFQDAGNSGSLKTSSRRR